MKHRTKKLEGKMEENSDNCGLSDNIYIIERATMAKLLVSRTSSELRVLLCERELKGNTQGKRRYSQGAY